MTLKIGCVVEGHGEYHALPVLLRRIVAEVDATAHAEILRPFRKSRSSLLNREELEKAVEALAFRVRPRGGILVLVDSDDECPKELAPKLLARAAGAAVGLPTAVILAH